MSRLLKSLVIPVIAITVGVSIWLAFSYFRQPKPVDPVVEVGPTKQREAISVPQVPFTDITAQAGIGFKHFSGATGSKLLPETMGSGVLVIDYNRDFKPDLLFINSCPWPGHAKPDAAPCLALYRNNGDGAFSDVTAAAGLNLSLYGIGGCVGDVDNDGFEDFYVTCVGGHRLFRNVGGTHFEDITATADVAGPGIWPKDESEADFLKHAEPLPFGTSATFLDFDGDGKLDLFVCHYCTWSPAIDLGIKSTLTGIGRTYLQPISLEGNQCRLYRNLGGGRFADVTVPMGVHIVEAEGTEADAKARAVGKSLGVSVYDVDRDGWPDIFVSNDTVRNFFFHNRPDGKGGRKFVERGKTSNVAYAEATPRGGMGIDVGEYRPGKPAVLIANFANEPNTFLVLSNPKTLTFADAAAAASLFGPSRGPLKFGAFFFDYDLDGRLDLLTANGHIDPDISKVQANQTYRQAAQLFWNTGDPTRVYEPVTSAASGADLFRPIVGRGSTYLDIDGDGDLDVLLTDNGGTPMLLRNDQATKHHWIRLHLEGDGVSCNRSALGAEVTVEADGKTLTRTLAGARGYLSQPEHAITVGLGDYGGPVRITVKWPNATAKPQVYDRVKPDAQYQMIQGTAEPLPLPR